MAFGTITVGLRQDEAVAPNPARRPNGLERRRAAIADLLEDARPVNTRAVLAAALLGAVEPELPVAHLVAVANLFGISPGAARTSLWRMVSDGELTTDKATYALAGRLLERRHQVDTAARTMHADGSWDGTWELDVVLAERRAAMDRLDLRKAAVTLRLAEIREGIWTRPANLDPDRSPHARDVLARQCAHFDSARSNLDPEATARLFGLPAWASTAGRFIDAMRAEQDAAPYAGEDLTATLSYQFTLSIAVVTHLEGDPLLPTELLPYTWPAEHLRITYREFDQHFQHTMTAAVAAGI